jgi:hypothetical protein
MQKRLVEKFLCTQGPLFLQAEFRGLLQDYQQGLLDVVCVISQIENALDTVLRLTELDPSEVQMFLGTSLHDFTTDRFFVELNRPKVDTLRLQICIGLELLRACQPDEFVIKLAEACEQLRIALSITGTTPNFNSIYADQLLARYKTRISPAVLSRLGQLLELEADTEAAISSLHPNPTKRRGSDLKELVAFNRPLVKQIPHTTAPYRKDWRKFMSKEVKIVKHSLSNYYVPGLQPTKKPSASENIQELAKVAQRAFYKTAETSSRRLVVPVLVKASPIKPRFSEA